jgi:hypothetical protein
MANPNPAIRNKQTDSWTEKQLKDLEKLYPMTDNDVIAEKISKTVRAVRSKAVLLRLKKSNRYWQMVHEKWLLKNYPVLSTLEIADAFEKKFGLIKTRWAIINKYRELAGKRQHLK